jgi:hypothetical protein
MRGDTMRLPVGTWLVVSEDGLWYTDDVTPYFPSKRDAIEEVSAMKLDPRRTPKVTRQAPGEYTYHPKDVDSGLFGETYLVVQVTKQNRAYYEALFAEQAASDEENATGW